MTVMLAELYDAPECSWMAVPFDTLALARKLEAAGFPAQQAEALVDVIRDIQLAALSDLATRQDIRDVRTDLDALKAATKADIRDVEQRLTIRGALGLVALGTFLTAIKYFGWAMTDIFARIERSLLILKVMVAANLGGVVALIIKAFAWPQEPAHLSDESIYTAAGVIYAVVMAGWGWRSAAGALTAAVAGLTTLVTLLAIKAALYWGIG
jgi:hypothetical protein